MRREGFKVAQCDRRLNRFLVKDLYGFGDVMGYDPTHLRRLRLVNGCKADLQDHIRKYLSGGVNKKTGKVYGPNPHLVHLMTWFDLYIYSFVKRTKETTKGSCWIVRFTSAANGGPFYRRKGRCPLSKKILLFNIVGWCLCIALLPIFYVVDFCRSLTDGE
jgi:hypothetical protein